MTLSRRNFLKRAGGVAAVAAVAPVTLAPAPRREALVEQRIPDHEPPALSEESYYPYILFMQQHYLLSVDDAWRHYGFAPSALRRGLYGDWVHRVLGIYDAPPGILRPWKGNE